MERCPIEQRLWIIEFYIYDLCSKAFENGQRLIIVLLNFLRYFSY